MPYLIKDNIDFVNYKFVRMEDIRLYGTVVGFWEIISLYIYGWWKDFGEVLGLIGMQSDLSIIRSC